MTSWLQRAYQELLELWAATEKESYADRHQVRTTSTTASCVKQLTNLFVIQAAFIQAGFFVFIYFI